MPVRKPPKPIAHAKVAEGKPERVQMRGVQIHVADFVETNAHQAVAELGLGIGEGEQRPAHELRRLQLVVKKRTFIARARCFRLAKGFRLGQALATPRRP